MGEVEQSDLVESMGRRGLELEIFQVISNPTHS